MPLPCTRPREPHAHPHTHRHAVVTVVICSALKSTLERHGINGHLSTAFIDPLTRPSQPGLADQGPAVRGLVWDADL